LTPPRIDATIPRQEDAMSDPTTARGIPASLDPEADAELVIERTLAYGDRRELRWLFARYGEPRVRDWVRRMGWRRLPRRRFNLWCVLLEIDAPERPPRWEQRLWPH
jgi:hypothetical protein